MPAPFKKRNRQDAAATLARCQSGFSMRCPDKLIQPENKAAKIKQLATMLKRGFSVVLALLLAGCTAPSRMTADQAEPVVMIEEHSLSKDEAFQRLSRWAARSYADANEAVQLADEDAGTLVIKGAEQVHHTRGGATYALGYTMTVDVRDGRLRFTQSVGEPYISSLMVAYVTETAASEMRGFFEQIRASALQALRAEDDF